MGTAWPYIEQSKWIGFSPAVSWVCTKQVVENEGLTGLFISIK
jgi:hypothetical protein